MTSKGQRVRLPETSQKGGSKTILIVLLAVVTLAGAAYGVMRSRSRTPQDFYQSGKKYYDQKQYQEARIEFLNAVRKDPRYRDARSYLARTYIAEGNIVGAVGQLKALIESNPDDTAAALDLGHVYLNGGLVNPDYFKEAEQVAEKILAKEPNNVDALILSGNASSGLRDYSASVETLEKAAHLDPQNSRALVTLGAAEALRKNLPDAEKAFLKAREADPKDKASLLSLANYYKTAGDSAKAEATFKEGLALYPADRQIYLQATDFYMRAGRPEDVEKTLQQAIDKSANDPFAAIALADFYDSRNRPDDAKKVLLDMKTKFPNDLNVAMKLATRFMNEQPERAKAEIDQIIKRDPKSALGYMLLGQYQFAIRQYDAAAETLGKDPALNSKFPQVHLILGNLARQKGQLDQAVGHFQKSLDLNKEFVPTRLALAEAFLDQNRLADSREAVQKVLEVEPNNPRARFVKASVDLRDKRYPEAEKELLALEKEQPNNPLVQRQLGIYYDARGKSSDAEKSLLRTLDLAPNSEESLHNLVFFYIKSKQFDRAVQKIESVPDSLKQAFHYELKGIVASLAGKDQDAENAFRKAVEKDPKRTSSQLLLYDQYVQDGHFDEALKLLNDRIKADPSHSAPTLAMKGSLFELQGKTAEAKQNYEQALQADPNQDSAANNLAFILANEGRDLDTALRYAQAVRNRHPDDPNVADTLGWVYYKMGRAVLARESALFAASKQPDEPQFQYHLGLILKANNQRIEAEAALKKAVASNKDFKEKAEAAAALKDIDHWRHLIN